MSGQLLLYDPFEATQNLLPFTYTRPVSSLRVGILTIYEKWEHHLETKAGFVTRDYLQSKYRGESSDQNLLINGTVCPDESLVREIKKIELGHGLVKDQTLLAYRCSPTDQATSSQKDPWEDRRAQDAGWAGLVRSGGGASPIRGLASRPA